MILFIILLKDHILKDVHLFFYCDTNKSSLDDLITVYLYYITFIDFINIAFYFDLFHIKSLNKVSAWHSLL